MFIDIHAHSQAKPAFVYGNVIIRIYFELGTGGLCEHG